MASRKTVSDAFKAIDGKKIQIELWGSTRDFLESFLAIVEDSGNNRVKLRFPDTKAEEYIMYNDIQTSFRSNIDDCDMQFRYNLGIVDYKGATVKISII